MNKPQTDWKAWIFQFTIGLVAGALTGYILISLKRSGRSLLAQQDILPFILGAALAGGALVSYFRLWNGYGDIPQSNFSRLCLILIGVAGAGMMIYAILTTVKVI